MSERWLQADVARGADYDERWRELSAQGVNIHGEADLVEHLLADQPGAAVLDAGCGTGRVAIELTRRGFRVTGVDADPSMLEVARHRAPDLDWYQADLIDLPDAIPSAFEMALLAGNVMIFLDGGTEQQVLSTLAGRLVPGGLLVAGFSLLPGELSVDRYDEIAAAAGLRPVARWAGWDRAPFTDGDYAVSAHRREGAVSGRRRR